MSKQSLNSQQAMMKGFTTDYPGFQCKFGSVAITVAAGEPDVTGIVLSTKFPNAVLWSQISFGAPNASWSITPRGQQTAYHSGANLCVDLHYANATTQQTIIYYAAFGY